MSESRQDSNWHNSNRTRHEGDHRIRERSRDHRRDGHGGHFKYRERSRDGNGDSERRDRRSKYRNDRRSSSDSKRRRSRSPRLKESKRRRTSYSRSRSPRSSSPPTRRSRQALPSQAESFGHSADSDIAPAGNKQRPNFGNTGLLAKEANTVAGTKTVLKYHEPKEARKPPPHEQWRLYTWARAPEPLHDIELHSRSCWLFGRDTSVVDIEIESERASKQHAVIQFRYITKRNEYGDPSDKVKPYLIDLDSSNGTRLNGEKVQPSRYIELRNGDTLKFAGGEYEYAMFLPPADMPE